MFRRRPTASAQRGASRASRRGEPTREGRADPGASNSATTSHAGYTSTRSGGKGRPTPKRREAERERRKRVRTPRDRKDAYRQARSRAREERTRRRRALTTGDERYLPPRDQGPVKAFARDYVDSRRRGGELFLPGAVLVFALSFFPNPQVQAFGIMLWLLLILFVIIDSFRVVFGIKREVARRFPRESPRGLGAYVVMRGLQIRRFRLPPPRVKPGARV